MLCVHVCLYTCICTRVQVGTGQHQRLSVALRVIFEAGPFPDPGVYLPRLVGQRAPVLPLLPLLHWEITDV